MNPHIFNRYIGMKFDMPIAEIQEPNPSGFGQSLGNENEFKQALIEIANQLGIKIKRSWGIKKLRKAIDDHATGHSNSGS